MKNFAKEKLILPEYPRTKHINFKANAKRDDLISTEKESVVLFTSPYVYIQEKVDGASVGMTRFAGEPLIRNRNHILRKGYVKKTPAKEQFLPIWTWYYKNEHKFVELEKIAGQVSVYGDWCVAQHGLEYNLLPDWLITYDLFDCNIGRFIDPKKTKEFLIQAGFSVVPELHVGTLDSYETLEKLANQPSPFTTLGHREGLYVKVSDGNWVTHRFKMVREGFEQGSLWSDKKIKKNSLMKGK